MTGVAKCDEHGELQDSVNPQYLESTLCCRGHLAAYLLQCVLQFSHAPLVQHVDENLFWVSALLPCSSDVRHVDETFLMR